MKETVLTNQVHPPRPKYQRVDKNGNDRRKMYYKDGNSTMLLCKDITVNAAKVAAHSIRETFNKLGTKLEGNILIVQ